VVTEELVAEKKSAGTQSAMDLFGGEPLKFVIGLKTKSAAALALCELTWRQQIPLRCAQEHLHL
jgi:hypothetical protein